MGAPKLVIIRNRNSRATLLSAWSLALMTVPTLLLTACGNRESKAAAISSRPRMRNNSSCAPKQPRIPPRRRATARW